MFSQLLKANVCSLAQLLLPNKCSPPAACGFQEAGPAPWAAPLRGQLLVAQNRGLAIWGQYLAMARQNLPKKICGRKICGRFFAEIVDKRLDLWYNIIIKWESIFYKKNKAIKKDAIQHLLLFQQELLLVYLIH